MYRRRFPGLNYLHREYGVIHTDLKPDNIMVKLEERSLLAQYAQDKYEKPLPQKVYEDGHIIYLSRRDHEKPNGPIGLIEITGFDLQFGGWRVSRWLHSSGGVSCSRDHPGCRLHVKCGYMESRSTCKSILGASDLKLTSAAYLGLSGRTPLFDVVSAHITDEYDDEKHLAYITAILGPPPSELLVAGKRASNFYGFEGIFKNFGALSEVFNFESNLSHVAGEEKEMFINFVRRMLKWKPEERSTAEELLGDPWLNEDNLQG